MARYHRPRAISIHSPHARGDSSYYSKDDGIHYFNPLPSCEGRPQGGRKPQRTDDFNPLPSCEGRRQRILPRVAATHFNPLPSCEGRRRAGRCRRRAKGNFNPLPSCEGRHAFLVQETFFVPFQSTPLMRGETGYSAGLQPAPRFQSTPLMRGETTANLAGDSF